MTVTVSSPDFWDELYAARWQAWELGGPTPTLVDFVTATPPPTGRVAVPGCGRGHDVRYLTRAGYAAVGFDFSAPAIRAARTLARMERVEASFVPMDVFELPRASLPPFDGAWEYTCYCAIDPARRGEYVDVLAQILRPGGWFLGCFFPTRDLGAGPPFPIDPDEVRHLFGPAFRIEREYVPETSPRPRLGLEWLMYAIRR